MKHSVLRFFYIFLFSLAGTSNSSAQTGVWDKSPIGMCAPKASSGYLSSTMREIKFGKKKKFYLVWDSTPGANPMRSLLVENRNGSRCVILFLPYSDEFDFKLGSKDSLPKIVTSKTHPLPNSIGDSESIEIQYELDQTMKAYKKYPIKCRKLLNSVAVGNVDCNSALN